MLRPLIDDLRQLESNHGLLPEIIFFTGDAAFGTVGSDLGGTLPEQYRMVNDFIEAVRHAFSVPVSRDNIFLVPGNHDIDRRMVTFDQSAWLADQANMERIYELLRDSDNIQWKRYMERLAAYRDFLIEYKYPHLLSDPGRLIFAATRNINGLCVGIAGFNSVWSCGQDGEKGRLWFGGGWQSGFLSPQLESADIRIALSHHPLTWFNEHEDPALSFIFQREYNFFLHGHEHLGWISATPHGYARISAAACYDRSDKENGYNVVRLSFERSQAEVWLRQFDSRGGGWIPRIIYEKTDGLGMWQLGPFQWIRKMQSALERKAEFDQSSNEANICIDRTSSQEVLVCFFVTKVEYQGFLRAKGRFKCFTPGSGDVNPLCDTDQLPATVVSWDEALEYCDWKGGRLPFPGEHIELPVGTGGLLSSGRILEWRDGGSETEKWVFDPLGSCLVEQKHSGHRAQHLGFRCLPVPPSEPIRRVFIEGGEFLLGTDISVFTYLATFHAIESSLARPILNRRKRSCKMAGFYISDACITNEDYLEFTRATRSKWPRYWNSVHLDVGDARRPFPKRLASMPVVGVTAEDAQSYCRWAKGRLPQWFEWERAASGGHGRRYPWGDEYHSQLCNSVESGRGSLVPINEFARGSSDESVRQLCGNVAELVIGPDGTFELRGGSYLRECKVFGISYVFLGCSSKILAPDVGFRCVWT